MSRGPRATGAGGRVRTGRPRPVDARAEPKGARPPLTGAARGRTLDLSDSDLGPQPRRDTREQRGEPRQEPHRRQGQGLRDQETHPAGPGQGGPLTGRDGETGGRSGGQGQRARGGQASINRPRTDTGSKQADRNRQTTEDRQTGRRAGRESERRQGNGRSQTERDGESVKGSSGA